MEHTQPLQVKEEEEEAAARAARAVPTKSEEEPRESRRVMTETKGRRGAVPQGDHLFAPLSDSDDIEDVLRSGTDSEGETDERRRVDRKKPKTTTPHYQHNPLLVSHRRTGGKLQFGACAASPH